MQSANPFEMDLEMKNRLLEEQLLHALGYKVWDIPKLTRLEKQRLVKGYILFKHPEHETEEEIQAKSENLIQKRRDYVKRRKNNRNGR